MSAPAEWEWGSRLPVLLAATQMAADIHFPLAECQARRTARLSPPRKEPGHRAEPSLGGKNEPVLPILMVPLLPAFLTGPLCKVG